MGLRQKVDTHLLLTRRDSRHGVVLASEGRRSKSHPWVKEKFFTGFESRWDLNLGVNNFSCLFDFKKIKNRRAILVCKWIGTYSPSVNPNYLVFLLYAIFVKKSILISIKMKKYLIFYFFDLENFCFNFLNHSSILVWYLQNSIKISAKAKIMPIQTGIPQPENGIMSPVPKKQKAAI